jgi:hypothetical protein
MFTTGRQTTQCWVVIALYQPIVSISLQYHLQTARSHLKQKVELCHKVIVPPDYHHHIYINIHCHSCGLGNRYISQYFGLFCVDGTRYTCAPCCIYFQVQTKVSATYGGRWKISRAARDTTAIFVAKSLLLFVYRHPPSNLMGYLSPYTYTAIDRYNLQCTEHVKWRGGGSIGKTSIMCPGTLNWNDHCLNQSYIPVVVAVFDVF